MIDKKLLFNVYRFGDNAELVPGLVRVGGDSVILSSPCIVDKSTFELAEPEDTITVVFPFSYQSGAKPHSTYNARRSDITLRSGPCIVNNRVQDIEIFDFSKLKRLSEHVNEKGSASFNFRAHRAYGSAIATGKNAIEFIKGLVPGILKKYSHHSVFYINHTSVGQCPNGDLRYFLHFINMPNCVPILNRHKVDGIGIVFNIVSLNHTLKYKAVNPVFCLTVIVSNYRENIFVIDGISVADKVALSYDHMAIANKIIQQSIKQKGEYKIWREEDGITKPKPKQKLNVDLNKWKEVTYNTADASTSTVTTSMGSNGISYYYTS